MFNKILKKWTKRSDIKQISHIDTIVYERNPGLCMSSHELLDFAMYMAQNPSYHYGVEIPSFPCITQKQYDALSPRLQFFFVQK